jgi:hypothetical protein
MFVAVSEEPLALGISVNRGNFLFGRVLVSYERTFDIAVPQEYIG